MRCDGSSLRSSGTATSWLPQSWRPRSMPSHLAREAERLEFQLVLRLQGAYLLEANSRYAAWSNKGRLTYGFWSSFQVVSLANRCREVAIFSCNATNLSAVQLRPLGFKAVLLRQSLKLDLPKVLRHSLTSLICYRVSKKEKIILNITIYITIRH